MYRFKKPLIVFYKNVNPSWFLPLWEVDYTAHNFSEIKDIEKYTEDEISSFSWFFEDMEENYQSSPEDFS